MDHFTLIEMLLVIAIVAILATILLPVLNTVKHTARQASCINNQRQIMLAILGYADDNNDNLPVIGSACGNDLLLGADISGGSFACLASQGYMTANRGTLNCPGRSEVYTGSGYWGLRLCGYSLCVPGSGASNALPMSITRKRLLGSKIYYAGGNYWLYAPLACFVGDSYYSANRGNGPAYSTDPISADEKDLPHRGKGVVAARLDGSAKFVITQIRIWPGWYWAPNLSRGNGFCDALSWKLINEQ